MLLQFVAFPTQDGQQVYSFLLYGTVRQKENRVLVELRRISIYSLARKLS